MYSDVTYENIMDRMLNRVRSEYPMVDTRQGSLVYTAIAPIAIELAIMYMELDRVLDEVYPDTASLDYLIKRAAERGITQRLATNAVMEVEFNVDVPIGTRFNLDEYNYIVTAPNQVTCETTGSAPNTVLGELTPIDTVTGLNSARIVACAIPGEDDEDVEEFRKRYFESLQIMSYGFNIAQYREVTNALDGVGATKVTPAWNGGGTVKLTILNSDFDMPSDTLIANVQNEIDPINGSGTGLGLAPIGHRVTVVGATELPIDITTTFEYDNTYSWDTVSEKVYAALDKYFSDLRGEWATETLVIRINQINSVLMNVVGVIDVSGTTLNGGTSNITLTDSQVPVRGTVNGNS